MKKILLSPFLVIIAVWLLFSFPFFFQNKAPFPSLYQVNFFSPWSAYPEFASPYKSGATPDVIGQIYPWRVFTIETWKAGQVPLWNPYSFSGTYHLANYQSAVFSPLNIGFFIFPFIKWWSMLILLQPLLAGLFTVLFVRSLHLSKSSQMISGLSFMFCGFLTTWMAYGTLGYAILFLPLALFAIEKFLHEKKLFFLFLLFLTIPSSFFSGHFQISLYFLLFTLYYLFFKAIQTKQIKNSFILFTSIIFGLMVSSIQLFPSIEAYSQSLRSGIFQKVETIPWNYFPTFLAPDFFGNPVTRNDWFGHYAEWSAYIGIIPLFFAVYALFKIRKKDVVIFFVPVIATLLLAFPSPLLDLLIYLKIPVLSTSAASRIIVLFSFSASILSGYGLFYFIQDIKNKKLLPLVLTCAGFILLFSVIWSLVLFKFFPDVEKAQIAFSNLRLPSLFFAIFLLIVAFLVLPKNKKGKNLLIGLIVVFTAIDMFRFATKWQPFEPEGLVFKDVGVAAAYKAFSGYDRVFMGSGAEGMMYYDLPSVEGYDAVYKKRYGDFIASLKTGTLDNSHRSVVEFPKDSMYATTAANFLGIKYIVHKISDGQNVWVFPFWRYDPTSLHLLYDDGKYQVLENTNVLPRTFFVNQVITQLDAQRILDLMLDENTNLIETAIIEEDISDTNFLGTGSATITNYTPNKISIKTDTDHDSFLVLTDSYSSGWNAYINGRKTKIYRTDFTFRGVFVPAHTDSVIFKYEPESFRYGIYTAIIGFTGMVLLLVYLRKKKI